MNEPVPSALLGFDTETVQALQSLLGEHLNIALERSDPKEGLVALPHVQPQAVLLYFDTADLRLSMQLARRIRHDVPSASLVLVSHEENLDATREAVRIGARAVVVLGEDDRDLLLTFEKMRRETHKSVNTGTVVSLLGAKGGMGTTSLAINLASALARDPKNKVLLLDLALFIGEVGVYLDMQTPYSLSEFVRDLRRLDQRHIDERIPKHRTGFFVLSQPPQVDEAGSLEAHQVISAIAASKRFFTHIIVDAGAQLSEAGLGGVNTSDLSIIVCTQELPAIVSTGRRVSLLTQLFGDRTRIRIVLNRFQSKGTSKEKVEQYVGHKIAATVCNDYANMSRCIENGKVLLEEAPAAEITADIAKLIRLFDGETSIETKARRKLFGLF